MEKKNVPTIHQNGKEIDTRNPIAFAEGVPVIKQDGREFKNALVKNFDKGVHAIAQNGVARFGHKDAIRNYNAGILEDLQNKDADPNFDSELYLRRLGEFAITPPDDIKKLWKIKDSIGKEEKKALEEIIQSRGINPEEAPINTGEEIDPEYNDDLYTEAVTSFTALGKDKIKIAYANKKDLTKEEQDALDHVIQKKNIKV